MMSCSVVPRPRPTRMLARADVQHVRTKDSFARLDAREIDLLCGGFASIADADAIPGDYEFLQWRRDGLVLLTNLPKRELPMPAVSVDRLLGVPLIVPSTGGVIVDFCAAGMVAISGTG